MSASAVLAPEIKSGRVHMHLSIENSTNAATFLIEPWQLLRGKFLNSSLLTIQGDGTEVEFTGPMVKRKPESPEELIHVDPGQSVSGDMDITDWFSFLPGDHTYTARYRAFVNTAKKRPGMITVESTPVSFRFQR